MSKRIQSRGTGRAPARTSAKPSVQASSSAPIPFAAPPAEKTDEEVIINDVAIEHVENNVAPVAAEKPAEPPAEPAVEVVAEKPTKAVHRVKQAESESAPFPSQADLDAMRAGTYHRRDMRARD